MKLSDEQFQQVIAAIKTGQSSNSTENRSAIRLQMGTRASIIPCAETGRHEPVTVVVLNVSESGIGILNGASMRVGENFIVRLPAIGKQPAGAILCSVIHSKSFATGIFAIGAQFNRILAPRTEQQADPRFISGDAETEAQDLAHLRLVEDRLNHLSLGS